MSQAYFYLKARVNQDCVEQIKHLIEMICYAYNFWQSERSRYPGKVDTKPFWRQFESEFPQVTEFLRFQGINTVDERLNALVGKIDVGGVDDIGNVAWEDGVLHYWAEVWDCSDWQPFVDFLKSHFEITSADWISEESVNPFDLLKV